MNILCRMSLNVYLDNISSIMNPLEYNNMYLPEIKNSNSNMKNKKDNNPIAADFGIGADMFGLGIQVFKIQSSKVISSDHSQKRKLIKNIENPNVNRPQLPMPKKIKKLPSLDHPQQQSLLKYQNTKSDAIKSRKSIGKSASKPGSDHTRIFAVSKQAKTNDGFSSKSVAQTKNSKSINKTVSKVAPKTIKMQQVVQGEKLKSKTFYWNDKPMNQLIHFYDQWQKAQKQRQRQLRKLSRVESADLTIQMRNRLGEVSRQQNTVYDLVLGQSLGFFEHDLYWQDNQIVDYDVNNGFQALEYKNYEKNRQSE